MPRKKRDDRTPFGQALVQIREDFGIDRILDLAAMIKLSVPYLSAIEIGDKDPPPELVENVAKTLNLGPEQRARLEHVAQMSRRTLTIPLQDGLTIHHKTLAIEFANLLEQLDISQCLRLRSMLAMCAREVTERKKQ